MKYATQDRFRSICAYHGVPEIQINRVYKDLVKRYSENHRSYHNLEHIDLMLGKFTECQFPDDEIELAIWFHDVIYAPKSKVNERQSADYFLFQFQGYLWTEFAKEVERLIIATDPHLKRRGSYREDLIIDIDLSILGTSPQDYFKYSQSIRKEYSYVSDSDYREGRKKVLQLILSEKIYATRYFRTLEEKARENIENEIKFLDELVII